MRWLLPESIEDVLPDEAARLEQLRRALLDEFSLHGYEFVIPPMLEFLESLLTGSGSDLDLQTFKLMDRLSGRSMGVRADMTPQVARIDAHLLNRRGVTRLCYCGSVLRTVPDGLLATREPIQIGAEIYGHEGLEADIEVIRLLACSMRTSKVPALRIDIGHVGIFRALVQHARIPEAMSEDIFTALQGKDAPALAALAGELPHDVQVALRAIPELYGDVSVLDRAEHVLNIPGQAGATIGSAIAEMRRLAAALQDLPISFDLSDMRGYHYHNGVAFAAYAQGSAGAIARGGRYDNAAQAYGRQRPATGFSMDLRELIQLSSRAETSGAVLAPWPDDDAVLHEVERLRASGVRVVQALPGHEGQWREAGCDKRLVCRDGRWITEPLEEV